MLFDDIQTVMWKARKGLFRIQGRRGQTLLMLFTPLMLAILFPIQMGEDWPTNGFQLVIAIVVPLLLVGTAIPAAFASEREQHTLATLLASRLSDRAILYGKILNAVIFGWGMTILVLFVAILTANIAQWDGQVIFYKPSIFLADLVISLIFSTLVAGAGVLFSLKAESVQQAQQSLISIFLIPGMLLQAGFFLLMTLPTKKEALRQLLESVTVEQVALVIGIVLAIFAAGCLWLAAQKFNRASLILD
jgi:ABC-2 type transport system permease protein